MISSVRVSSIPALTKKNAPITTITAYNTFFIKITPFLLFDAFIIIPIS